jgi:lipopolysaccharide transport system permease protein
MVFNLFSEVINRAPGLILNNVNYVKKVIFPLEILPVVSLGAAAFHLLVSLCVWLLFFVIFVAPPHRYMLLLPMVLVPLVLWTLGIAWLLSSLGVYLRDVGQVIGVVTAVLTFLSPIFYPVSALPVEYQGLLGLNPMAYIVEETRNVLVFGRAIDWARWALWSGLSAVVSWLGFAWFQKTRRGFADVL